MWNAGGEVPRTVRIAGVYELERYDVVAEVVPAGLRLGQDVDVEHAGDDGE